MNMTKPPKPFQATRNGKSSSRIAVEEVLIDYSKKGGITIPRIAEIVGVDVSTVRKAISPLRDAGQIINMGSLRTPVYVFAPSQETTKAAPVRTANRSIYDGMELRPYEGRPGAMRAYSLPSLRDGVLVPYNGIRPQLVGALKDQQNNAR